MEIAESLRQLQHSEHRMSPALSPDLAKRTSLLRAKHGADIMAFMTKFNPSVQMFVGKEPRICHLGDFPTLGLLNMTYGTESSKMWLAAQLYNLSEFCGCKNKLEGAPLEECASIIANEYNHLKVTELMLFFYRFKNGWYGKFYGAVDPLVITTSLHEFVKERNVFFDKYNSELQDKRIEEGKKGCISYAEYLRQKAEREKK